MGVDFQHVECLFLPSKLSKVWKIKSGAFSDTSAPCDDCCFLPNLKRQRATVANLHRLGVRNALVCCHDGRKIPFKGVDRVLLDAPCSGEFAFQRMASVS